jgi:hypothetical protein
MVVVRFLPHNLARMSLICNWLLFRSKTIFSLRILESFYPIKILTLAKSKKLNFGDIVP